MAKVVIIEVAHYSWSINDFEGKHVCISVYCETWKKIVSRIVIFTPLHLGSLNDFNPVYLN